MPWLAKKRCVRFQYFVAMRSRRPWRARKARGDVVEILHRPDVDPELRHRDDDIGVAEAERREQRDPASASATRLAQQVLAGDAEMHVPGGELARDLGGGEERDLDAVDAGEAAAILPPAALLDGQAGAREQRLGLLLQAALGGERQDERAAHAPCPAAARSSRMVKPTAGIGLSAPSMCISRS